VILGWFERQDRLAVTKGDEADLLAGQKLFDDHARAGGPDQRAREHRVESFDRFALVLDDDDALAGGESVGLDHQWIDEFVQCAPGLGGIAGCGKSSRGDAVAHHKLFGEDLAALQLGGSAGRAEDAESRSLESIDNAVNQGRFGTDNREIDGKALRKVEIPNGGIGCWLHDLRHLRAARIAWSDEDFRYRRAESKAPADGVFTPAAADDHDFHAIISYS